MRGVQDMDSFRASSAQIMAGFHRVTSVALGGMDRVAAVLVLTEARHDLALRNGDEQLGMVLDNYVSQIIEADIGPTSTEDLLYTSMPLGPLSS
jgi:hypothetical protein